MEKFLSPYITPAAIGILGALLVKLLSLALEHKKVNITTEVSLRECFLQERTKLIDEINSLAEQLRQSQTEVQELRERDLSLLQNLGEYQLELKRLQIEDHDAQDTG